MCNRRETSGSNRNELMHGHARTAVLRGCPGLCCCVMLICPLLLGKSRIACVYCVGAGHGKLYIYILAVLPQTGTVGPTVPQTHSLPPSCVSSWPRPPTLQVWSAWRVEQLASASRLLRGNRLPLRCMCTCVCCWDWHSCRRAMRTFSKLKKG